MSGSAFQLLMAQGWLSIWTTLITINLYFSSHIYRTAAHRRLTGLLQISW